MVLSLQPCHTRLSPHHMAAYPERPPSSLQHPASANTGRFPWIACNLCNGFTNCPWSLAFEDTRVETVTTANCAL